MLWYGGSVAEAVTLSKRRNAIFVVFIEGDNDLSVQMARTIDDAKIVNLLSNEADFLAIKLNSNTENYLHFAKIYQFVPVPSLFFIGRNGTPLEVVCAGVETDNLASRIDRILDEHRKQKVTNPLATTSAQDVIDTHHLQAEPSTSSSVAKSHHPLDEPGPASKLQKTEHTDAGKADGQEIVCDGDVCVRRPRGPDRAGPSRESQEAYPVITETKTSVITEKPLAEAQTAEKPVAEPQPTEKPVAETAEKPVTGGNLVIEPSASNISVEEKLQRAKELIEARKREKIEKEREAEIKKEMERRLQGQGAAELKKWQSEQELKQMQEERKREKLENNLARQRILEQIAQDRAERRARETPLPTRTAATVSTGDGTGKTRIQFKMPDGASHTAHFDTGATLGDVQRYVADNLQLSESRFALWTAFPRRELSDASATLQRLQLTPSAALLVLARQSALAANHPSSGVFAFLTRLFTSLILQPTQQFYQWVYSRLFPPPTTSVPRGPISPGPIGPGPTNPTVRRRGNIHRLPGDRSGDDDNNTWNGNSTQQM